MPEPMKEYRMVQWHGWDWGCGGGMMGFGMLLAWIVPIGLIGALVWLVWYLNRKNTTTSIQSERALDILEKAYARGEISREEFLTKRNDLSGKGETPS